MPHATLVDRLVYGTPEDEIRDPMQLHLATRPGTALAGRLLLGTVFVVAGFDRLLDPSGVVAALEAHHLPAATTLARLVAVAELLGGASIMLGLLTRVGALGLLVLLVPTSLLQHGYWNAAGVERAALLTRFVDDLALGGGLALLVAYGAGRYSVDYVRRRPVQA